MIPSQNITLDWLRTQRRTTEALRQAGGEKAVLLLQAIDRIEAELTKNAAGLDLSPTRDPEWRRHARNSADEHRLLPGIEYAMTVPVLLASNLHAALSWIEAAEGDPAPSSDIIDRRIAKHIELEKKIAKRTS
mgnify:CR=1 FL=1